MNLKEDLKGSNKNYSEYEKVLEDHNAFTNAIKFIQQDISDKDNWDNISDTKSELSEPNEELDKVILNLKDNEKLNSCIIIDKVEEKIQ
ncbi:13491_t:CDS:2 [Funneliformis mosseae]|uniref:13491_t:CDS:1 n=1 Tax=Funneliformis mosseae TaxID=27381 RepID=A0A9N9HLJ2_FUNMO|nr:13491_t:CDS:2 [Funneliformis mosseae]